MQNQDGAQNLSLARVIIGREEAGIVNRLEHRYIKPKTAVARRAM